MKLRSYNESCESSREICRKKLQRERPNLFKIAQAVAISSIDTNAYSLLEKKSTIFAVGIGATEPAPVSLRLLAYATLGALFAQAFNGTLEIVSGSGIAIGCGFVRKERVEVQVKETQRLIQLLIDTCFPDVSLRFSNPIIYDLDPINYLIERIKERQEQARIGLGRLGTHSVHKGKTVLQGEQYGVLHAFAFDLREEKRAGLVTIGNPSEDLFNCVRYGVLQEIGAAVHIDERTFFPPVVSGHIITNRCEISPYNYDDSIKQYEPLANPKGIAQLKELLTLGRKNISVSISSQEQASKVGSVIKDLEFLVRTIGIDALERIIKQFSRAPLENEVAA